MLTTVKLTKREEQIAELLAWGASKKEIPYLLPTKAGRKPIAIRTVENTVRNIYEKLGIQKVNELAAWYFCTRFKISFDLSPLHRKMFAVGLLALFIFAEFSSPIVAVRSTSRISVRARSGRQKDESLESTYQL